ncbi:MAG: thiamine phosphate synthase [Termitinemataceae bacterium]|nr:MAG: thiamine phosphate synthase [Termitinemataceae bacterium]
MKPKVDYSLYLVTDSKICKSLPEAVQKAILGGVSIVQLREKSACTRDFYNTAVKIKEICSAACVPLIINDRIDIALACDACGVHVGQGDMDAVTARRLLGCNKIIGVSVSTLKEAQQAQKDGADYIGLGAMFPTATKDDAPVCSKHELLRITQNIKIPAVLIGGMNKNTIPQFAGCGQAGYAVVSAILAADDPQKAAAELRCLPL